jgi:hypothetical protein
MRSFKNNLTASGQLGIPLMIAFLFLSFGILNHSATGLQNKSIEKSSLVKEVIWQVKAVHPEGYFMEVRAFDREGNNYPVKSIQYADQTSILDIKADVEGKNVPIKILVSNERFMPVKGIMQDGTILNIKAVSPDGDRFDVKGVSHSGNIIHIKAVSTKNEFYGVKAISPEGELNDVKGLKMSKDRVEAIVNNVEIYAHIKAIAQSGCAGDNFIWHIKAIHPEGRALDVKALDKDGNLYDVKALQDSDQSSLLDVKAFIGDMNQSPVKILLNNDKYAPVKAIGDDGTIYDIKALESDGSKLDLKGVKRSGNLIHIKAINSKGSFYGVKAISPNGQLNDVKGVKMLKEDLETTINGVEVYAHIKAIPQK